jgi:hypothetical protein
MGVKELEIIYTKFHPHSSANLASAIKIINLFNLFLTYLVGGFNPSEKY